MADAQKIAVRLSRVPVDPASPPSNTVVLRLPANSGHGHADGQSCVACASQTDVRALLYNLLEEERLGRRPAFSRVLVDASGVTDSEQVIAALTGKLPATALRDHVVARTFKLEQ